MIGIIDYGSGNKAALLNIYKRLNIAAGIIDSPEEIARCNRLILPGVGDFDVTIEKLAARGWHNALDQVVAKAELPLLGICVGMQVMAESSEEGSRSGFGWIPGEVTRFAVTEFQAGYRVPHMGWNSIAAENDHPLLDEVDLQKGFYFLHSYYFRPKESGCSVATSKYITQFTCIVGSNKVFGVQFHPEKSHTNGITLLKNFSEI